MQSSEHPIPPDRSVHTRADMRLWVTVAGLAAIAAIATSIGIVAAREGNLVAPRYCLLFALAVALIAVFPIVGRYRRVELTAALRRVEVDGVPGVEIRYALWPFVILIAMMACFAVFCVMAAVEIPIRQDEGFPGAAVIAGGMGLVFVSFLITVAIGRIRRGRITLSSRGITHRGWSFESRLDWPDIVVVMMTFIGHEGLPVILVGGDANAHWIRRDTTRIWRMERLPNIPMIQIDFRPFDIDPYQLFRYVQTYVDNPELRDELGTEATLHRALTEDWRP